MELTTERLRIIPLNIEQFALFLRDTEHMEAALGLNASHAQPDRYILQAMGQAYLDTCAHPAVFLWYTCWQFIQKADNIAIGCSCFMGVPNAQRELEIAYAINESQRRQGYMTEALGAFCQWLASQKVSSLLAETDKKNRASQGVLEKCGFVLYEETEQEYLWAHEIMRP